MPSDPRCERTDLPRSMCAHCKGLEDFASNIDDYKLARTFKARYEGNCAIEPSHVIFKWDDISRVVRVDNPFLPVAGYACRVCTARLLRTPNSRL